MSYFKVFAILAACWFLQLLLGSWQIQRFNRRYNQMRSQGDLSAVGTSGKYWQGRVYAILVCDKKGTIVASEYISGFTVFSKLSECNLLVDKNINILSGDNNQFGIKKKIWAAFVHSAEFIQKKLQAGDDE